MNLNGILIGDEAAYAAQLLHKVTDLRCLLETFHPPEPAVYPSTRIHYRYRAEFRIWRVDGVLEYAMFAPGTQQPILLEQFPVASLRINALMHALKAAWQSAPVIAQQLFQVEFLTTLQGEALITLCYHRPLAADWQAAAFELAELLQVQVVGRARGQRCVVGRDYVCERFVVGGRTFDYQQPEGAFSQPNPLICQSMLDWLSTTLGKRTDDALELYCGNGNFTLPLAIQHRRVLATEVSKTAVAAALANLSTNQISNVALARLSAAELTDALRGVRPFRRLAGIDLSEYAFGTVLVDPPRAGLDLATCGFIQQFERIVYISCNPATLVANLARLQTTHKITSCALFDQFPWTHHLEVGVLLECYRQVL